jgi:hypothetical protein
VGKMKEFEYIGHLHIHSTFSDGTSTVEEIARDALKAGLDFLCITDHNTMGGLDEGMEGWKNGVLVLFGTEVNMSKNHYLAYGLEKTVPQDEENPQNVIDAVNAAGGFGYLAHPVEKGNPLFLNGSFYAWDDWDVTGFTGLEIWNFGSLWRSAYKSRLKALFWLVFNSYRGARFPDPDGIKAWDTLSRERPVAAFAGSDAHAFYLRLGPFKIRVFPYEYLFRTLNTHILLHEELSEGLAEARGQVFSSLRSGRFFIGSDYLGQTKGFRFSAVNQDGEETPMGGEISYSPATVLHISVPSSGRRLIRVIKNGQVVHESGQKAVAFKVLKPGTFRVEVWKRPLFGRPVPWIYSNPIYIR